MKNKIKVILILTILVASVFSVSLWARPDVIGSESYDNIGYMKLNAGLGIMGSSTWNHNGSWWFNKELAVDPYLNTEWSFNSYTMTWNTAGRWFVSGLAQPKSAIIRWTDDTIVHTGWWTSNNPLAPAKEKHNLTQMFEDDFWIYDSTAKAVVLDSSGSGAYAPLGKFNTMKIRVVAADGTEKFYWIGDTATGSFTYARTYFTDALGKDGLGKYGTVGDATWVITDEKISVRILINTVYNQARFDVQITNNSDVSKGIGFAMTGSPNCIDYNTYDWSQAKTDPNDGITYRKISKYYVPGIGGLTAGKILSGSEVPNKFEIYTYNYPAGATNEYGYPSLSSYITGAQATLGGGDATKPDYLIVDNANFLLKMLLNPFGYWVGQPRGDSGAFDTANIWPEADTKTPYTVDPTYNFSQHEYEPTVYMLTWKTSTVTPSETKRIITYYGMPETDFISGRTVNGKFYRDNMALFIECPTYLNYSTEDTGEDNVNPSEFTVTARVVNMACERTVFDINNISVKINLPAKGEAGYCGLELADGETATKTISGTLGVNSNAIVQWTVKSVGDYSGNASFTVTSNGKFISNTAQIEGLATDEWEQTATRNIVLPTTKKGTVDATWTMGSTPFNASRSIDKSEVFGAGNTIIYKWDPVLTKYTEIDDIAALIPGEGYWIGKDNSVSQIDYTYPGDMKLNDVDTSNPYYMTEKHLTLYKGWNLIGNPYVFSAQWFNCKIRDKKTGNVANLKDSVNTNRWLGGAIYNWNDSANRYDVQGTATAQLLPNKGYWVYAYRDLEILFTPTMFPGTQVNDAGTVYQLGTPVPSNY